MTNDQSLNRDELHPLRASSKPSWACAARPAETLACHHASMDSRRLAVGCEFTYEAAIATLAIFQVQPGKSSAFTCRSQAWSSTPTCTAIHVPAWCCQWAGRRSGMGRTSTSRTQPRTQRCPRIGSLPDAGHGRGLLRRATDIRLLSRRVRWPPDDQPARRRPRRSLSYPAAEPAPAARQPGREWSPVKVPRDAQSQPGAAIAQADPVQIRARTVAPGLVDSAPTAGLGDPQPPRRSHSGHASCPKGCPRSACGAARPPCWRPAPDRAVG